MKNQKLTLFNKGNFKKIDHQFMTEGLCVLQDVTKVQQKYKKDDTDTFINELRDSIAGYTLGFDLVNTEKHGFDCKLLVKDESSKNGELYLEVKSASFCAKSWQATFNDTTLEKAEAFKDEKVYLALAVWKDASDLLFICYGQNEKIGDFLEKKVNAFKNGGKTVRSTQSISLSTLVFKYKFKILAVNKNKEETLDLLKIKNRRFQSLTERDIISLNEFKGINN